MISHEVSQRVTLKEVRRGFNVRRSSLVVPQIWQGDIDLGVPKVWDTNTDANRALGPQSAWPLSQGRDSAVSRFRAQERTSHDGVEVIRSAPTRGFWPVPARDSCCGLLKPATGMCVNMWPAFVAVVYRHRRIAPSPVGTAAMCPTKRWPVEELSTFEIHDS